MQIAEWVQLGPEALDDLELRAVALSQVLEGPFARTNLARDEQRLVRLSVEKPAEQADVVGGAADVHPRNHAEDSDLVRDDRLRQSRRSRVAPATAPSRGARS